MEIHERRPVLVVGFANSACERALDLDERRAEVRLAVRYPVNVLPRDIFGVGVAARNTVAIRTDHLVPAGPREILFC
jgi:cation diffusion facilitator CzcD-associated flavoprotein CzcO